MAITILNTPATVSPVYNTMFFTASSTNTAQTNFQYLFDLYISGQTFAGANYLRFKVPSDPTYGRGVFDPAKVLERYLTYNIDDTTYGFQSNGSSILNYTIKCGEEYGPSSGVVQYADLTVDSSRYAFNGVLNPLDFLTYSKATYVATAYTTNAGVKMLTNRVTSGTIRTGEDAWVHVMADTSGAIKFAKFNAYNSAGVLWKSTEVMNVDYYNTSTVANTSLRFPCGPNNTPNTPAGHITSGNFSNFFNTASTSWYEVYFTDSARNRITESQFFKLDTSCTEHTEYRLHFLNKFGGFDSFTFIKAHVFNTDIKRQDYKKVLGKFISSSNYNYQAKDVTNLSYYTEMKDTLILNSDWVNENIYLWLEELISSPVVFYQDSTSGIVNMKVTDAKFTRKQHLTDKIFNMQITLQYSFDRYRQRQ